MSKIKRFFICCLGCALIICVGLCSFGCANKKEKKYDVTIKVKNNFGSEWIFTPDIQELTYEFEYTGEEMRFWVDSYNLPDHPDWGDKWFGLTGSGPNAFKKTMAYCSPNGLNKGFDGPVKEIGEYFICFEAMGTSNLWNYRAVYLNITVL